MGLNMKDHKIYKKDFENGKIPMPSLIGDNSTGFYLQWHKYIYGKYCADGCDIGLDRLRHFGGQGRSIAELRAYSQGAQDIEKYKKIIADLQ